MEQAKAKIYKRWYQIFMVIGSLGLLDIATRSVVEQNYNIHDMGVVSLGLLIGLRSLVGVSAAAIASVIVSTILGFSLGWFALAYFMNNKAKVVENPNEENLKKFKRAKVITVILAGLFGSIVLYTIFLVLNNP